MKSIIDLINTTGSIPKTQLASLMASLQTKKVSKGQVLQVKGDISDTFYFVKKGLLRSYVLDAKGKEHIFMFAPEGWLISDTGTLDFNAPSDLYIDAVEDSEVERFNKEIFINVTANYPSLGLSRSDKLMKRIAVLQKRVIMLMSATALERYVHFLETYPNIVQRVPQKMIASYLGITPEALSKIRGSMVKGK